MITFMILAFPLMIVFSLFENNSYKKANNKKTSILIGFLLGMLYSFIDLFFMYAYYLHPYTFMPNFLHNTLHEIIIPFSICILFILIFIKKQPYTWNQLYFVLIGFYAVYFPSKILNENTILGWYLLFIKPLIAISMVYACKNLINYSYTYTEKRTKNKKTFHHILHVFLIIITFLLCIFLPACIETVYLLGIPSWILITIAVAYIASMVSGSILIQKKLLA